MLHLLTPIWLTAIAALSIPVIIHLWNIRPGKTLKVGSILLMAESSRKSSRSFNLMDIILLLLRCLFLALLALLLAGPYKKTSLTSANVKGWVLIPRQNIHQVYSGFKPRIDSLIKAGYQLRYFNDAFATIDTAKFKTLPDSAINTPINNWALLKQLSNTVPGNLLLYVFAANNLSSLTGTKPLLAANLHIQTFTPADSAKKWISSAVLSNVNGSLKITEGGSTPAGTVYTSTNIQQTDQRASRYQINIHNGQLSVAFKNDSVNQIIDTATLRIAIYSDKNSDAEYLKAALNAVKQFTYHKVEIQTAANPNLIKGNMDWVFWLRERPITLMVAEGVKHVFVYQPGKPQNVNSWINLNGKSPIGINKLIVAQNATYQNIWTDGFSNPVLSLQQQGQANLYHFYSRFDASWGDLVWDNNFPRMMLDLLFNEDTNTPNDRRSVDVQQLIPNTSADKTSVAPHNMSTQTDLSKAFWLALVLVLLIERWFAYRNIPENYG